MAGENDDEGQQRGLKRPASQDSPEDAAKRNRVVEVGGPSNSAVAYPEVSHAGDIFEYLRLLETEPRRRPRPDYMEQVQPHLNARMRGILVDWLIQLAEDHDLYPETTHLSVSYIDQYLSSKIVTTNKLQLLGASAMLISTKYEGLKEEAIHLGAERLSDFTLNTYTEDEVIEMESAVLKALECNLGTPTVMTFLRRFNEASDQRVELLGNYLAGLSMLDYSCIQYLPSLVAASAVFLARFIDMPSIYPWSAYLESLTAYRASELKGCVQILHQLFLGIRGRSLDVVREKYKKTKFNCVASIPAPPEIPSYFFVPAEVAFEM